MIASASGSPTANGQDAAAARPDPRLASPIGWPLLGRPDENGLWSWPDLARSVAEGLHALLAIRPGELLLHPGYGAGLQEFLNEPNTLAVRARMRDRIEAAITRYEPRVIVQRIDVDEDNDVPPDPRLVRIAVHYRLRRTGESTQLSATMNLGG